MTFSNIYMGIPYAASDIYMTICASTFRHGGFIYLSDPFFLILFFLFPRSNSSLPSHQSYGVFIWGWAPFSWEEIYGHLYHNEIWIVHEMFTQDLRGIFLFGLFMVSRLNKRIRTYTEAPTRFSNLVPPLPFVHLARCVSKRCDEDKPNKNRIHVRIQAW